jgi:hypothetical protein
MHGSLLLTQRPVLLCHRRLGKIEQVDVRHKRHVLVHGVDLNGIVQEEKVGIRVGVPFHLTDQRLLTVAVRCVQDLVIELAEFRLLDDPIVLTAKRK